MRVFLDRSQYIIHSARGRRREFGSLKPRRLGYKGRCKGLALPCPAGLSLCKGEQKPVKKMPLCLVLHIPLLLALKKIKTSVSINIIAAFFAHSSTYFSSLPLALSNVSFHTQIPLFFSCVAPAIIFDLLCCFCVQFSQFFL